MRYLRSLSLILPLFFGLMLSAKAEISLEERYESAQRFLPWNAAKTSTGLNFRHHWLPDTNRFWYRDDTKPGKPYTLFDTDTAITTPAFDHERLAEALSEAAKFGFTKDTLPDAARLEHSDSAVAAAIFDGPTGAIRCDTKIYSCTSFTPKTGVHHLVSPDGKKAAFIKNHNLWVLDIASGKTWALTKDGIENYAYGVSSQASTFSVTVKRAGATLPPVAVWSPDSSKLIIHRLDERAVAPLTLVEHAPQDGSARPRTYDYAFALPEDTERSTTEYFVIDVENRKKTAVSLPHESFNWLSPIVCGRVWWAANSQKAYVLSMSPYQQSMALNVINAKTGKAQKIIEEVSETYIEPHPEICSQPNIRTLANGKILWYSEKSGWGHIYRVNEASGEVEKQLTSGEWQVRDIPYVNETTGRAYILGGGREDDDPYMRRLYSVDIDNGDIKLLTPEAADHQIITPAQPLEVLFAGVPGPDGAGFSPKGNVFVDTYSRPGQPPTTIIRNDSGETIKTLIRADVTALNETGFLAPEEFSAIAADGKTQIYGAIFRPSYFDPKKKYPVIDQIYPGPQTIRTLKGFSGYSYTQAMAELGFIVVTVDGRGTPFRSKAIHDATFGDLGKAGFLEDHVAAIEQLAKKLPQIDLDRIGIVGHSAGGFAATRAILTRPDFYKAAFVSGGIQDHRAYLPNWSERYLGPASKTEAYDKSTNIPLASQLQGKLMLVHGGMDDNVHPSHTYRMAQALINESKRFEMFILPNAAHDLAANPTYIRLLWDFLVEELMGETPPENVHIKAPGE